MASQIFISYSRQDTDRVRPWAEAVQRPGTSVWMDVSAIDGGSRWGQQITTAIEESQAFLLMLSASSVNSEHVLREVSLAMEAHKPILPLLLAPVTIPPALRSPLAGLQQLELFGSDQEAPREALLRALARLGVPVAAPEAGKRWEQAHRHRVRRRRRLLGRVALCQHRPPQRMRDHRRLPRRRTTCRGS